MGFLSKSGLKDGEVLFLSLKGQHKPGLLLTVNAGTGEQLLDCHPGIVLQVQSGVGNAEAADAQWVSQKKSAPENGLQR